MINKKDFRIENIVNSPMGSPCKLREIDFTWDEFESSFTPIELNKEWFEKLGLEKSVHGEYWNLKMIGWFAKYTNEGGRYYYNVGKIKVCDFKYVHELQNLYHVITGHELTAEL